MAAVLSSAAGRLDVCLLLMVALQIYVGGSVESWTVAGAFGQRRFIALTTAMVIGYAALDARDCERRRRAGRSTAVTVLAVYWNLALTAEFSIGLMDRQRLEPRKNAYDAFVTLPLQAPSLAYRYLFDRRRSTNMVRELTLCESCIWLTSASRWSAPTASSRWRPATRSRRAGTR